jgi:hypothetical protein
MRRRDFIKALAGSTANWPPVARAKGERMRRIGVLMEFVEHDREGELAPLPSLKASVHSTGKKVEISTSTGAGSDSDPPLMERCAAELVEM